MALLIRPQHRATFSKLLDDSYRLRHLVFVERMGWHLPKTDNVLEIDEFDGGAAAYLLKLDKADRVVATLRITPSTEPNVSCNVLAKHMGITMPTGPHIVEMSRMCVDPELSKDERREVMLDMRICISTLFLRNGWTHGIGVGYDHHIQPFIRTGMKVEILGPPAIFPGDRDPSFAIMTSDPDRSARLLALLGGRPNCLQDPDEDDSLIARYGNRAVA
jgi:N-acyl-L-homoserine lactone synthetase